MNIAFCINRLALAGLGVTVASLVRNCSDSSLLKIYFLCSGLLDSDKDNIHDLLKLENYGGEYHFIDFNPKREFGAFRSLHGDWTAYGRLLLPDLVTESRILYLDADLAVELDVLQVSNFDLKGLAFAAVQFGTVLTTLENDFFINSAGLSPDAPAFNSGILLFDLDKWRNEDLKERCLVFARKYPTQLLACDQTLLNSLFANQFAKLPESFNCPWYPGEPRPSLSGKMILHYVGSPKPWDIGGGFVHSGYRIWKSYLNPFWADKYIHISYDDMKRAWKIRRSYFRILQKIFFNKVSKRSNYS